MYADTTGADADGIQPITSSLLHISLPTSKPKLVQPVVVAVIWNEISLPITLHDIAAAVFNVTVRSYCLEQSDGT